MNVECIRMLLVPLRQGPDGKRREKPFLIEHPRKDTTQLRIITEAEEIATLRAGHSLGINVS
jgi:hypothetical protein